MCSALAIAVALLAAAAAAQQIPAPQGYVTDAAGVIDAPTRARIEALAQELQQRTGAEIAVLTVDSTAPLDDFSYAMQVAETWKVGKRGEDTGVLVLLAVRDRKVRVVTGYGVEGVLPDGVVGAIQDREMVPEFRAGRLGEGLWRGVAALAGRIAAERGVRLTGMPAARPPVAAPGFPLWLLVVVAVLAMLIRAQMRRGFGARRGPIFLPGGFGGRRGGGFGGFGGGGGGFGGFGGGGFGGGGAGRSW